MIEKLIIWNFQKHRKLAIGFERITCIVGASDKGKSSVIRALKWVCFNRPSGESFITFGEDDCKVKLEVDDQIITRFRSKKGENYYGLEKKIYKAFGTGVPEEVASLLALGENNFQDQHESPFWFFQTAAQTGKELNAVVDLSIIDSSLSYVSSELKRAKYRVEVSQERLEEAQRKRASLLYVPELIKRVDSLTEQESTLAAYRDKTNALAILVESVAQATESIKVSQNAINTLQRASDLEEEVIAARREVEALELVVNQVESLQKQVKEKDSEIEELISQLSQESEGVCPVCGGKLDAGKYLADKEE